MGKTNIPLTADLVKAIVDAVVNEISCQNAGVLPADKASLELVKARAEAETAKLAMEQAKVDLARAKAEQVKTEATVENLRTSTAKLKQELKALKRQQALSDAKAQLEVEGLQQKNALQEVQINAYRRAEPLGTGRRNAFRSFQRMRSAILRGGRVSFNDIFPEYLNN